jgi:hypothetical protein
MSEYFIGNPDLYDERAATEERETLEVESWMYPYDPNEDDEDDES